MQVIKPNKYFILSSYLIMLILIYLVPLIRFFSFGNLFVAGENYVFLTSLKTGVFNNIYFYLLGFLNVNTFYLFLIVPLIFSILSLYLFSKISLKYSNTVNQYYVSMSFFILNSTFIILNVGIQSMSLLILLFLFFIYSLFENKYLNYFSYFLLSLFFPLLGLIILPFLIYYNFKNLKDLIIYVFSISLSLIILLLFILPRINTYFILFDSLNVTEWLLFFGGYTGYSFMILIFGLLGLFKYYKKSKNIYSLLFLIFYFVLSLFNSQVRILMIIIFTILGSEYFYNFVIKKWHYENLVYGFVVLVFCIFFFTLSTSIQDEVRNSPHENQILALNFLSNYISDDNLNNVSTKDCLLLTDISYNSFIYYYSNIEPFNINDYYKESVSNSLFYSRKYSYISEVLKNEKICYILIDEPMVKGNIWYNKNEDLLFVIKNNVNFNKIYDEKGVQIYKFNLLFEKNIVGDYYGVAKQVGVN